MLSRHIVLNKLLRPLGFILILIHLVVLCTSSANSEQKYNNNLPILLTADELKFDDKLGILTAIGNVEISHKERVLTANKVSYNQANNLVTAAGNVVLVEPTGEILFSEYAELTDDLREGFLRGFKMLLEDDSRLAAISAQIKGGNKTILSKAIYSACRSCLGFDTEPIWNIKAEKVIHDQIKRQIIYRNARLELLGLPIAFTPYLSHPDPAVIRRSGILTPTFGGAASLGSAFRLPYFWSISGDKDLTFDPIIYASNYPLVTGEYRQSFSNGELKTRLSAIYDETNKSKNRARGHIDATLKFAINNNWRWGSDVKLASDDTYLSRFGFPGKNTLKNRVFIERFSQRSYLSSESVYFQGLRDTDKQEEIPLVLPKIDYNYSSYPDENNERIKLNLNFQSLKRKEGTSSQRASISLGWFLPHISNHGIITTMGANLQTDAYNVTNNLMPSGKLKSGTTGRIFPQIIADWRYPWIKRNNTSGILIEPMASLILAPNGGNPELIPNEDSLAVEFDESNLFSGTRFPGKDRVESGSRISYGLRGGLYSDNGSSSTFIIGQSYKFNDVDTFAEGSGLNEKESDVVGRITISPNNLLDISYKARLDVGDFKVKRTEVSARASIKKLRTNINYIFFDEINEFPKREEIQASFSYDLTNQWTAQVDTRRDVSSEGGMRSWGTSLKYNCDCLDFTIDYRRTYTKDRDVPPEESVFLRLVFKTLGEFGVPF